MKETITVWALAFVLFGHWLADFFFQPHWMGLRKSKEWWVLTQHALRITVGGLVVGAAAATLARPRTATSLRVAVAEWALLNGAAHFAIDAVTSRVTSRLWREERVHEFFTVIGFDQLLHTVLALATFAWLVL